MDLTDSGATTFAGLIKHRPWRASIPASILARLPQAMLLLAWVIVGNARAGSLTLGATLAGVASLAACGIAPLRGRLLDRQDLRRAVQLDTSSRLQSRAADRRRHGQVADLDAVRGGRHQGVANAGTQSGLRRCWSPSCRANSCVERRFVESLITESCSSSGRSCSAR